MSKTTKSRKTNKSNNRSISSKVRRQLPLILIGITATILSLGLVLTLMQTDAPASTGSIYLEKSSVTAKAGEDIKYVVRIAPGAHVDTVTATVKYDTKRLSFLKAEYIDSPFTSQIPAININGEVTVQSAKLGGKTVNSDSLIATLIFKPEASGTQSVSLIDGNSARAGLAMYPTIAGKQLNPTVANSKTGSSSQVAVAPPSFSVSHDNSSLTESLSGVASPVASVLQAVGVPAVAAKRASVWVLGLVICVAVATAVILARKKFMKSHKPINQTKQKKR